MTVQVFIEIMLFSDVEITLGYCVTTLHSKIYFILNTQCHKNLDKADNNFFSRPLYLAYRPKCK